MLITSVRIKKINTGNVLGVASIQLDNCLVIHNIKLIQLEDKRIISFPNRKVKKYELNSVGEYVTKDEYTDIVHPSNKDFREYIETALFEVYDKESGDLDNETVSSEEGVESINE